jgi:hypothetical protein
MAGVHAGAFLRECHQREREAEDTEAPPRPDVAYYIAGGRTRQYFYRPKARLHDFLAGQDIAVRCTAGA